MTFCHFCLQAVGCFEVFNKCPTIKFSLRWNKNPSHGLVDSPVPVTEALRTRNHFNNNHEGKCETTRKKICEDGKHFSKLEQVQEFDNFGENLILKINFTLI